MRSVRSPQLQTGDILRYTAPNDWGFDYVILSVDEPHSGYYIEVIAIHKVHLNTNIWFVGKKNWVAHNAVMITKGQHIGNTEHRIHPLEQLWRTLQDMSS